MKGRTFIALALLASLLIGCGDRDPKTASTSGNDGKKPEVPAVPKFTELKIDDIEPGKGEPAKNGDMLTMLYEGKLTNGKVFDSNMTVPGYKPMPGKNPFALTLGMGMVIPGWDQGLVGIKKGAIRKLSIPSNLGYGSQAQAAIPANSDLIFTVKCLDIIKQGEELVIDITNVKPGSGAPVKEGDMISVHYVGKLLNDKKFDSSRDRKEPFNFTVGKGEVVPGFDKGVIGMKKGGVRIVRIPPMAAYGADPSGAIPGNSVLIFEIEVLKINGK